MPKDHPADRGPNPGHSGKGPDSTRKEIKPQGLGPDTPTRGASIQGDKQNAKGGPAGASQGGAPRGGSRVEPSHQQQQARQDRSKK